MDDGDFEPVGVGRLVLVQVADPGEVLDDRRSDPAAEITGDDGLAELDTEHGCRLHPRVDAGDDIQLLERNERDRGDRTLGVGGGELFVALQVDGEVRRRHGHASSDP
ncbi:MAG: hypothetical protein ACRDWT_18130 [Jatrophihabitantaceae bacterium]